MAVQIDSVFYELALHDKEFAAALHRSVANLDQLDSGAKKADHSVGGLEESIKGAKDELKRFATNLVEAGLLREFIRNTVDAQAALAQLTAALRSTGGAAGFTLPQLVKMSEEFAHLSTFSTEAVQGGLSRLLTYTGIQGDMFKEAARATIDFATALGIDTTSAAERVGNALQYPTEAINSLTKQGFRFTAEQKRLIASFEDTGQLAKAQAIILGELDLAYKGSAEAARGTLGGALAGLKNDFESTLEVSKESSSGLIEAINSVAAAMPALRDKFNAFFGGISLLAVDASVRVQKFLNLFRSSANKISDADLEAFRTEEQRKILGLDTPPAGPPGKPSGTTSRGLTDAELQARANARAGFAAAIAAQTQGSADNFDTEVTRLVNAARKAHVGAAEIQQMVNDLRDAHAKAMAEEGQKLALTLQGQLAQLTATTADDLRAQLAEFDRSIDEQRSKGVPIDPTVVNQLRAAKEEAIALAPQTEAIATAFERIKQATDQGFNLTGSITELDQLIEQAANIANALPTGSTERAAAEQRINELVAKRNEIWKQQRAIIAATGTEAQKFAANVANVAGGIANIANVAFGLASAFAGANSELAKMLGAVGQVAGGIGAIGQLATQAGGFGKLFSTGAGIASALPGLGAAIGGAVALGSALFGRSPEEAARLQALKENNSRLRELSQNVGDLGRINVTGTQLGTLARFFARPELAQAARTPAALGDTVNRIIGKALDAVGLSADEFKDIMRSFGLTIDDAAKITVADVEALKKAIAASELTQFATTFEGQMSQFNAAVKILDLSKPIDQFNALRQSVGRISGGGGALQKLLDSFDLTTVQGIEQAQTALEGLFQQLQNLTPDQMPAFLGGLTPQQFEQLIEQAIGIVRAQASGGGVAGTGGFNVDRTITEVTGSRLEALLTTSTIFEEQIAANTGLIAQLLGGTVPVITPPPSAGGAPAGGAGGGISIGGITVNVGGVTDPMVAQGIGTTVGGAIVDEISAQLGMRLRIAKLQRGRV